MSWRDLIEATFPKTTPYAHNPHNPQNPAAKVSFEDIENIENRGSILGRCRSDPADPCSACGGGRFYQLAGLWRCSHCDPSKELPKATLTAPGGRLPNGARQDVGAVLAQAVDGLPITADEFRAWCDPDDLADIARGLIAVATARAYAKEMIEQGPRGLGKTVHGVTVVTYDPNKSRSEK